MEEFRVYVSGKRVTVMGLGLLGRGVGDAKFLAECGAVLTVTDLKSEVELAESVAQLRTFPNIHFVLGEHRMEDFENRDFILKAAGVPLDSLYVAHARERGIPIEMSTALFAAFAGIPIIGVTGTRGKSTVTHLIHHILTRAGVHALLGGNVRGMSTLAQLPSVHEHACAVLELDSWQLQGFGERRLSPRIAVFTTFMRDHMNYYHDDMGAYFSDKANIFRYQHAHDVLVVGSHVAPRIAGMRAHISAQVIEASEKTVPDDWRVPLLGAHNRYNAGIAIAALRAYGLSDDAIREGVATFPGVPGRLELVREVDGVRYYNDTTATTPEATCAALNALLGKGRIVLIVGGADKGLDMSELVQAAQNAFRVILLSGTGTSRIQGDFPDAPVFATLADALTDARAHAHAGDAVLFSPAFASFGIFKNEFDRGDQFTALVRAL